MNKEMPRFLGGALDAVAMASYCGKRGVRQQRKDIYSHNEVIVTMKHPPRNIDMTCFSWVKLVLKTDINYHAKYLGLYLSTYMNLNQDMAFPSLKRIEGETGLGHATVLKYLDLLVSEGWLVKQSGNRTESNRYWINIPNVDQIMVGREATYVGSGEKVGREATSNNNIITKSKYIGTRRFVAPSIDEVRSYCLTKQYDVDAETFVAWNESKGWKVGNQPMKCWKSALTTWALRSKKNGKANINKQSSRQSDIYTELTDTSWAN